MSNSMNEIMRGRRNDAMRDRSVSRADHLENVHKRASLLKAHRRSNRNFSTAFVAYASTYANLVNGTGIHPTTFGAVLRTFTDMAKNSTRGGTFKVDKKGPFSESATLLGEGLNVLAQVATSCDGLDPRADSAQQLMLHVARGFNVCTNDQRGQDAYGVSTEHLMGQLRCVSTKIVKADRLGRAFTPADIMQFNALWLALSVRSQAVVATLHNDKRVMDAILAMDRRH